MLAFQYALQRQLHGKATLKATGRCFRLPGSHGFASCKKSEGLEHSLLNRLRNLTFDPPKIGSRHLVPNHRLAPAYQPEHHRRQTQGKSHDLQSRNFTLRFPDLDLQVHQLVLTHNEVVLTTAVFALTPEGHIRTRI